MNISVIGTGYVGLVCGAGFSEMGNVVICVDSDQKKIARLREGIIPIYEPGLEEMILQNMNAGSLFFTTSIPEAVAKSNICLIAVGTPMDEDGSADLTHVLDVAAEIGRHMDKHMYIVTKSTVPVGTADRVRKTMTEQLAKRGMAQSFDVISNPEFLKEGSAVADFTKPDRVVVGADNPDALSVMRELYAPFTRNHDNFIAMDIRSSEMTKYAANTMLANKISFMNEISNICERVGADINKVRIGIGSDPRIGYHFLYPGCGYGGSCLPKDVQALAQTAKEHNYTPVLLQAIDAVNQRQKLVIAEKVLKRFGDNLREKVFAVWGLAFKPGTDDMRDAPSVAIIKHLADRGAKFQLYDPKAMPQAKTHFFNENPAMDFSQSKYFALKGADALLLLTEWKEFRSPDFEEMRQLMRQPVVFDGRNQYDKAKMTELGFEYYYIGG